MTYSSASDPVAERLPEQIPSIAGFLLLLTGDAGAVDDLCQQTCVELLRLRDRYEDGTDFGTWARHVARIQVMRHWRSTKRNRAVPFTADRIEHLSVAWAAREGDDDLGQRRAEALDACVGSLEEKHREALALRYRERAGIDTIASLLGRTVDATKMYLSRLRRKLRLCVETRLNEDEIRRFDDESRPPETTP